MKALATAFLLIASLALYAASNSGECRPVCKTCHTTDKVCK